MRTINQQIRNSESTFRLAGAGVENYEKTIAGTEAKLSMLSQKLTQQQKAVEQYSRALVAANDKLKENYDRHQDYTQRLEQAKARQEGLRFEVEAATYAYEIYLSPLMGGIYFAPKVGFEGRRIPPPVGSQRLENCPVDSFSGERAAAQAHEGNRRNGHAGLPASAGMGCHTGAGKEAPPAALH